MFVKLPCSKLTGSFFQTAKKKSERVRVWMNWCEIQHAIRPQPITTTTTTCDILLSTILYTIILSIAYQVAIWYANWLKREYLLYCPHCQCPHHPPILHQGTTTTTVAVITPKVKRVLVTSH